MKNSGPLQNFWFNQRMLFYSAMNGNRLLFLPCQQNLYHPAEWSSLGEVSPADTHSHVEQLVVLSCVPTRNRSVTNPGVTSHSLRNADCWRLQDGFGSWSSSRGLCCENHVWAAERAPVLLRSRSDAKHLTGLSLCIYFPVIILGLTVMWKKSVHCSPIQKEGGERSSTVFCEVTLHKLHIDRACWATQMMFQLHSAWTNWFKNTWNGHFLFNRWLKLNLTSWLLPHPSTSPSVTHLWISIEGNG